ncbi:hypothetical protein NLJ89_g9580 [Agrocybe chaxingu]|uniref:Mitochondrial ATPase n=1 Tax=Agrocybe chaxingu TaxID=84603 RepID=A0A9W8MR29_9AGAR|nr:hypothetical protein NLJ89_g9580 [Agrocybe chaxingu]
MLRTRILRNRQGFQPYARQGATWKTNHARVFHDVSSSVQRRGDDTANLPIQVDLLEKYRSLVTLGRINYDEEQIRVVMKLRRLQRELTEYAPPALTARLLEPTPDESQQEPWWIFSERERALDDTGRALVTVRGHAEELGALDTPKGLLLTGPPGSGKSFLVDLWYQSVPTVYKARKHYNQLVLEIYRGVWEETQRRMAAIYAKPKPDTHPSERGPWNKSIRQHIQKLVKSGSLPIRWARSSTISAAYADPSIAFMVAKRLLLRHWLLVFDEIQLLDVSSANLLADVLSWYWRMGGVIVGTSNKVPDELYRNGVQRERLEPFVEALKLRCPVTILDVKKDWREVLSISQPLERTWFTYDNHSKFNEAVYALSSSEPEPQSRDLHIFGRTVSIPWASGSVCKLSFTDLCDQSLGPADYLTIASTFPVVVISDIPVLPLSSKNQARRFISLIDALYESKCRIVCLAETTPDKLFFPDAVVAQDEETRVDDVDVMMAESVAETQDVYRPNVSSYDAPQMREAPAAPKVALSLDTLSIFSGEEEQFAFKRALSRLVEMTSAAYNRTDNWTPLPSSARQWETRKGFTASAVSDVYDLSRSKISTNNQEPLKDSSPAALRPGALAEDFAEEVSYGAVNTPFRRPHAPSISSDHVWGVREDWGQKAKEWGKGTKVYSRDAETTAETGLKPDTAKKS